MTPTAVESKIEIPYPNATAVTLVIRVGPCRLHFVPSDGPMWITGTYEDRTGALPIDVRPGAVTTIAQRVDLPAWSGAQLPRLDLAISRSLPFDLEIHAGASDTAFDLGGLPITRLVIKAGGGRFDVDFSQDNPVAMSFMDLSAGAGSFAVKHLASAGFANLRFGGGVAACSLDFSGALHHDASARIDAGVGSVDVSVPATTAAAVRTKAFAATTHAARGFAAKGDTYYTVPGLEGKRPLLTIDVSMAFGALGLTTT